MTLSGVTDATTTPAPSLSEPAPTPRWIRICDLDDLEVERGRAALVDGEQVAVFLLHDGSVHAVQNLDPYSGAYVISRGIVGTRQEAPTVASPMYKQVFDLRTGICLETQGKPQETLRVWPVGVDDTTVLIKRSAR